VIKDDLVVNFTGLNAVQANIGVDGGLHVLVTEQLPDEFILPRVVFSE
jgi:hypothetical protein